MNTPPASLPVSAIRMACDRLADHASAARWLYATHPDEAAFHRAQVDTEFRTMAHLMGYDLVKRGEE